MQTGVFAWRWMDLYCLMPTYYAMQTGVFAWRWMDLFVSHIMPCKPETLHGSGWINFIPTAGQVMS